MPARSGSDVLSAFGFCLAGCRGAGCALGPRKGTNGQMRWPLPESLFVRSFRRPVSGASVASADPGVAGAGVLVCGGRRRAGLRNAEIELSTKTKQVLDAGEGSER